MITDEAKIGCIPLQQCIDLAMSELDDANGLLEAKLKPFAYECLKKFSRDSAKQPKTVVLPMSDIKTVTLPLDFIAYSKIGTLVGDKIKVFSINNSLANFNLEQTQTFLPPQKLPLSETINSVYNYAFVNAQNYNRQTLYGVGIGHDNWQEARVDLEAGCIRFSATVHAQDIILEYIGSGIDLDSVCYVNANAEFMFRDFILYKYYLVTKDLNMAAVYKENFDNEYRIVRATIFNFTTQDILRAVQRSFNPSGNKNFVN